MKGPIVVSILKHSSLLDSETIATVTRVYHTASVDDKRQILSEIHIEKQSDRTRFAVTSGLFALASVGTYIGDFNNFIPIFLGVCSVTSGADLLRCRTHYNLLEKLCKD